MSIRLPRPAATGEIRTMAALDLLAQQRAGSVGAVVTDPPFLVSIGRAAGWHETRGVGSDPWTRTDVSTMDQMIAWSEPLAKQCYRAIRPGGVVIMMGGSHSLSAWEVAASRAGLPWLAELTVLWNTGKPRARNFGSLTTTIRVYVRPGARHDFNSEARALYSNVLVCQKVPTHERLHPAQKPVELTNFLVSLFSRDDDLVVDPFCGSGSTIVSAAMCDRNWLGGDTDSGWADIARTRASRLELEEANLRPIYFWINGRLEEIGGDDD